MNRSKLAVAILMAASASVPSLAYPIGLAEGFEKALQQDRQFAAARSALDAGKENLDQAVGRLLPNVSISSSRYRVEQQRTDNGVDFPRQYYPSESDSFVVRQSVYSGRLLAGLDQARAAVAASEAQFQGKTQDLLNRYLSAYVNLLFAQQRVELTESQLKSSEARLVAATKGFAAGVAIKTDISEIQAQTDLLRAQLLSAQQAVISSSAELEMMVGEPIKRVERLTGLQLQSLDPGELQLWLDAAERANALWLQRRAERDAAKANLSATVGDRLPTLDVVAQISRNSSENAYFVDSVTNSRAIGFQINIPIYQGGYLTSRQRQAAAALGEADALAQAALDQAKLETRKAYYGVREGIKKAAAMRKAEASSLESVDANLKSFQAGVRSHLDVLEAEKKYAQASMDRLESEFQLLLQWGRLQSLVSQAPSDSVQTLRQYFSK